MSDESCRKSDDSPLLAVVLVDFGRTDVGDDFVYAFRFKFQVFAHEAQGYQFAAYGAWARLCTLRWVGPISVRVVLASPDEQRTFLDRRRVRRSRRQ